MKHIVLLFLLCTFSHLQGFASADDSLVVESFTFVNGVMDEDREATDAPVKEGRICFSRYVGLTDSARVELRDENGVVATVRPTVFQNHLCFDFEKDYSFPKGKAFSLVLVGGSVYKLTTGELLKEDVRREYRVLEDFGYDRLTSYRYKLQSLTNGILFMEVHISNELVGGNMLLYREGELVETCKLTMEQGASEPPSEGIFYLRYDFDKEVFLDKDVHYQFVLPAGSVSSKYRSDIKNREIVFDIIGLGEDSPVWYEDKFELVNFSYAYAGEKEVETYYPVKSGYASFSVPVGLTDTASVELRDENGVVATSPLKIDETYNSKVVFDFGQNYYPPLGTSFWLVLKKGSVYDLAHPEIINDEVQREFRVMESFVNYSGSVAFSETASVLQRFYMYFEVPVKKTDGAQALVYREGELMETCDFRVSGINFGSNVIFDFGKEVHFYKGVHYRFVLPAGSLSSYYRDDIVNREIIYDIIGLDDDPSAITDATSATVVLSCRGGILHADGVQPGTEVEVFTSGGSLVRRVTASQGSVSVPLPGKGCYVVRVGGKAHKVAN